MELEKYSKKDLSAFRFLVTGGAGFIGSNLVKYLLDNNAQHVRVLDNLSNGFRENIEPFLGDDRFEFIEGDIRNLNVCLKACKDVDFISHQAALGSVPRSLKDPILTNEVNIIGFLNMLVAARDLGIKRFVYAASSSTYGDSLELPKREDRIGKPLSPYAVTKYVNELYSHVFALNYNMSILGMRYFNVYGPNQDPYGAYAAVIPLFMKAIIEGIPPTINSDGMQSRDFTFITNVIQANVKALFATEQPGHNVINVACGQSINLNELWLVIQNAAGKKLDAIHGPSRKGDIQDSLADLTLAKQLIDYQPEVFVAEGIKETFGYFKSVFSED